MGLHARERRRLRQIEEGLRKDDPALDGLLAGRPPPRRPAPGTRRAWALLTYLVPPVLVSAGLLLHAAWLVLAGAALCPLVPVITWLLIRRHLIHRGLSHHREP